LFKLLLSKLSHWWAAVRSCSYAHYEAELRRNVLISYERAVVEGHDEWADTLRNRYGIKQPMVDE
jgi:hypothetical protein